MRFFSEGPLSPTVVGNLRIDWSGRGGEGRGEQEFADKGGGGGSGRFARLTEGIWRRNLEEAGEASDHVGKSTVAGLKMS